jgi:hypothetical protein
MSIPSSKKQVPMFKNRLERFDAIGDNIGSSPVSPSFLCTNFDLLLLIPACFSRNNCKTATVNNIVVFIIIPLTGYVSLWILGSVFFIVYFRIYKVPLDLKHVVNMIRMIPPVLAIITVPLCSFLSFFMATKIFGGGLDSLQLLVVGIISLLVTIGLDLLITVVGEKINILTLPLNLMYLFAWLVIVPSVILAGY